MSQQLVALSALARGLGYEVPLRPAAEIGAPGEFAMIEPSKLYIDPSYQRPIMASGKKNIRKVNETFHFAKFGALIVTRRGKDRYAVLDGQHHGIAAALHPQVKKVPCLVQQCTPEMEADVFATVNSMITRVHPLHLFKARAASGDKGAGAVLRVCKAAGVTILPYPRPDPQPGETLSPGRIEECIQKYGAAVTAMALELIVRANAGDAKGSLLVQGMIVGVAIALFRNPKWQNPERLLKAVCEKGLREFHRRALQRQAAKGGSINASVTALLGEMCEAAMGTGGGTPKGVKTLPQRKKEDGRRAGEVLRAMERQASRPTPRGPQSDPAAERAAIAAHLKSHGARKFESGATGDSGHLMDWLTRVCGIPTKRLSLATAGRSKRIYQVGKKKLDLAGLIDVANQERGKRKLQPITSAG